MCLLPAVRAALTDGHLATYPVRQRKPDVSADRVPLFHVSEQADIRVFHPRLFRTAPHAGPVVWAIDALKLPNYLVPRDCPRVTFGASAATTVEDRQRFGVGAIPFASFVVPNHLGIGPWKVAVVRVQ